LHTFQAEPALQRCAAVIVAAGVSRRMGGGTPKQFLALGARPVLLWSVDAFRRAGVGTIVVVAAPAELAKVRQLVPADVDVTAGGDTRAASVRAGLAAVGRAEWVFIHDAARPGVSETVVHELLAVAQSETADAAAPALPSIDALKRRGDDGSLATVDRAGLWRVQTPQLFQYDLIKSAHEKTSGDWVDDLALIEGAGAKIAFTRGRAELMKITEGDDIAVASKLLSAPRMRVGSGFDVHAFAPGDHVMLCGVKVPHTHGLEGHSDADVAWHAITDAILGAAALGDIGDHFPPSDPQWKGAASILFLRHAVQLAADRGLEIANVDVTLICERPKIGPHRLAMREATAEALGLPLDAVSVKATTTERLGFTGRQEGIAAQAVVLLSAEA
jgi:2-C-methyl-D-erythritol 4-phosphate cytidylyltransferase / 2-C-methyl-D-erythritol 2,4-cyclodiphosphate synthase